MCGGQIFRLRTKMIWAIFLTLWAFIGSQATIATSAPSTATMISTIEELEAAEELTDVLILGLFDSLESPHLAHLQEIAELHQGVPYYYSTSQELREALEAPANAIIVLKKFDDLRADFELEESPEWDLVIRFIIGNASPLVQTLTEEDATKIFSSPLRVHGLFLTDVTDPSQENLTSVMYDVAKSYQGVALIIRVPHTVREIMDLFSFEAADLPKFVMMDLRGEAWVQSVLETDKILTSRLVSSYIYGILARRDDPQEGSGVEGGEVGVEQEGGHSNEL
jgi:hypothetical protein